jgi:hypothetical protein
MGPATPSFHAIRLAVLCGLTACSGSKSGDESGTSPGTTVDSSTDTSVVTTLTPCESPSNILDSNGDPTGLVRCSDGSVNRVAAIPTDATFLGTECDGTPDSRSCDTDADCTEGPNGKCQMGASQPGGEYHCGCVYTCSTDADCGDGFACLPVQHLRDDSYGPICRPTDCATGADCDIRADDQPILAAHAHRSDWTTRQVLSPVPPATADLLARHWSTVARAEHASIASFARAALDLMALGAPPDLLAATQAACLDELRHAQLFFGLASGVSGSAVGPGPLPVPSPAAPVTPESFLDALLRDACVNETLAVCQAVAEHAACGDPTVQAVLRTIIDDETRHAALAWRTLRWLLEAFPHLRSSGLAAQTARDALRHRPPPRTPERALPHHGLLDTASLRAVQEDAIRDVLTPALHALGLHPPTA